MKLARRADMPRYVWIAYSNRHPYLPVAVADTSAELAAELAAALGISRSSVSRSWMRYRRGKVKRTRYHKVLLPQEPVSRTKEKSENV